MLSKVKIILTVFIIWISLYSDSTTETTIASILILSLGLVHGACDITLITTKLNISSVKIKGLIISSYVLIAIISFLFVYNQPLIGFVMFLLISSYHFGEQHLHSKLESSKIRFLHFLLYGMVIFMLMIETHRETVIDILTPLFNSQIDIIPTQFIVYLFMGLTLLLWGIDYSNIKFSVLKELFYLFAIFILFSNTNLIVSFAAYFIVWHSIPSINDQIEFLYKEISKKTVLLYLKNSGSYWAISLSGLIFLFSYGEIMGENFYLILYSFVLSITIPHIFLIHNILSKDIDI
ncbi:MAG: hypothetical protein CMC79_01480 [Flavobacteriaceae bacterium]|nr:hypothetical protein [Flavobacteriaceae bacterium]|tara:strand:+ start:11371 stop:12246 length:876 start_codon:yes stop_codon:yes gene_type:complete